MMLNPESPKWIIVLIHKPEREYLAIKSDGLMPDEALELKDGRIIPPLDFEVIVNDLTPSQAVIFMALPTASKELLIVAASD